MKNTKKFRPILLILLFGAMVLGCKEEHLITYDKDDSVYFQQPYGIIYTGDSIRISLGYVPSNVTDTLVRFIVRTTGKPMDIDRPIQVQIDPSTGATEGEDYVFATSPTMHAGRIVDTISMRLLRTPSLKEQDLLFHIHLSDNDFFNTALRSQPLSYRVFVSDIASIPTWWDNLYFGVFTIKKLLLMFELTGIEESVSTGLTIALKSYYGIYMQRYLNGMAERGEPIFEEDGITRMVMGNNAQ